MNFIITLKCNGRCDYCFAKKHLADSSEMQFSDFVKVINRFGLKSLNILGGEPTLHSQIMEFVRYTEGRGIMTTLFTNGFVYRHFVDWLSLANNIKIVFNYSAKGSLDRDYFLSKLGPMIMLGVNFNEFFSEKDISNVFETIERYGLKKEIRLGVCAPTDSYDPDNTILNDSSRQKLLIKFVDSAVKRGLIVHNDCTPFKRCLGEEMFSKIKNKVANKALVTRCEAPIDIFPDLKMIRCFAVSDYKYDLMKYHSVEEIKSFFSKLDKFLYENVMLDKCAECPNDCQSGCLYNRMRLLKEMPIKDWFYFISENVHLINMNSFYTLELKGEVERYFFDSIIETKSLEKAIFRCKEKFSDIDVERMKEITKKLHYG